MASTRPLRSLCAALTLTAGVALVALSARADTLQEVSRLVKQGHTVPALKQLDKYLSSRPNDVSGRFLKGVILVETNNLAEATSIFTKLTEEHPELPEPYNNLAVIYARLQQYDKAKQSLEMAIQTHPSYATAHKNLEDVYARLASQAYDKALQTDSLRGSAPVKLATIKEISRANSIPMTAPAEGVPPVDVALAEPKIKAPTLAAPAATKLDELASNAATAIAVDVIPHESTSPAPIPASKTTIRGGEETKPAIAVLGASSVTGEPTTKSPQSDSARDDVTKELTDWLAAWSAKNVDAYLGHYAQDFQTPAGESRAEWQAERTTRIKKPGAIQVTSENLQIAVDGAIATAKFRQHYRSAKLKTGTSKVLILVHRDGRWLIQQERIGK